MENHPLRYKIQDALDKIRPYLEADGGNVEIVKITPDNDLYVNFIGACKTCNMSAMTFKAGIEETIRKEVPEVNSIIELSEPINS